MKYIVDVYKNFNKSKKHCYNVYSIRHKGRVRYHSSNFILKDPTFHVSKNGRQRVHREKRKNVHAWIRGELLFEEDFILDEYLNKLPIGIGEIYYNPLEDYEFMWAPNHLFGNQPANAGDIGYALFSKSRVVGLDGAFLNKSVRSF